MRRTVRDPAHNDEEIASVVRNNGQREVPGLRIYLLGGFRVRVGQRVVAEKEWRLRKARSLFKLLALAPHHRFHREQIIDLLWPELDAEAAFNNLHRVVHTIRHVLEPA